MCEPNNVSKACLLKLLWCKWAGASMPPKPMMHIAYSNRFPKNTNFPPIAYFSQIYTFPPISAKFTFFIFIYVFFASPYFDHDASCFTRTGHPVKWAQPWTSYPNFIVLQ